MRLKRSASRRSRRGASRRRTCTSARRWWSCVADVLRVCALYPDLMNIYADRGNMLMLERRCGWRGIGFELTAASLGDAVDPDAHDLFYLGGGQDRDQQLCAQDLYDTKRDALRAAAGRGAIVLGICGGIQLLGDHYELGSERVPGIGLVDLVTQRAVDGSRLIGNVAIEVELPGLDGPRVLAGFENHGGRTPPGAAAAPPGRVLKGPGNDRPPGFEGGRTRLGAAEAPLGRVLKGHGNDGRSGFEGVHRGTVLGTYLHGPLLPKNAWFADWLLATALGVAPTTLAPLDDALEDAAHASARRAAGVSS